MENDELSSPASNNMSKEEELINGSDKSEVPISAVFSNNNSINGEEVEAYISSFPPGFRFYPTHRELVTHYLKRRLDNLPLHPNKIYEINIYKYNPDTIAAHVKPTTEEKVWYILTPRDRKYPNGTRPSRSAGDGYWKATGADKKIRDHENTLIGLKKTLVFHTGNAPKGQKTNWIMHEYRVPAIPNLAKRDANDRTLDEWVLCKIYKKSDINNTMFTQRKRSRECDEVLSDGQLDDSCNENLRNHQVVCDTLSKGASEYFMRHGLNDMSNNDATTFHPQVVCDTLSKGASEYSMRHGRNDMSNNDATIFHPQVVCDTLSKGNDMSNNDATTFHPQVATRFSNFPQCSHMPTYCNMSWSTTSAAYDSQSCASQFAPSLVMIEPISSVRATNSEGFGISCFTSSIGGSYIGQECYGVGYFGNEQKLNSYDDQCDSMDCVDQYLVTNYEMNTSIMYLSEYNTENLVNHESSKSKGDC